MSLSRRSLIEVGAALLGGAAASIPLKAMAQMHMHDHDQAKCGSAKKKQRPRVYFTKDISAEALIRIYQFVNKDITGKTALKVHTGEPNGPNIIPPAWVEAFQKTIPDSRIVECNVLYNSPRQTTEGHKETLKINGWTADIDIMDAEGEAVLPVPDGRQLHSFKVGKNLLNYDSMVVLTHFKGHTAAGFGGSLKNIAIGCGSGKGGKQQIHQKEGNNWPTGARMLQRMAEGGKAITNYFGRHMAFINVMRNMSVDCDCAGISAAKPVAPDFGILASEDLLAVDQACVDLVFKLSWEDGGDLIERVCSRSGWCQLEYMRLMNMGHSDYELVEI